MGGFAGKLLRYGFDGLSGLVLVLGLLALFGWHQGRTRRRGLQVWGELSAAERATFLSLGPDLRIQLNECSCLDSETFIAQLTPVAPKEREQVADVLIARSGGKIPTAVSHRTGSR